MHHDHQGAASGPLGEQRLAETLATWAERRYFAERLPGDSHTQTRLAYSGAIQTLDRFLGRPTRLGDLCDDLLAGAMGDLVARGRSPATANKLHRHAATLWRFARKRDKLPMPECDVPRMRELKREPAAWTVEQVADLMHAAAARPGLVGLTPAGEWWGAFVAAGFSTGLRVSALMRVETAAYDRGRGMLLVPAALQKHRADQWLDLIGSAVERLETLAPWDRGLPTLFGDWPYDPPGARWCTLRKHWRRLLVDGGLYASDAEIPKHVAGFHRLRKSFATQVVASSSLEEARERLGHSSVEVTRRYVDRRLVPRKPIGDLIPDPVAPPDPPPTLDGPSLHLFRPDATAG